MSADEPKEAPDPILAAMDWHRKLDDEADDLFNQIERAKINVDEHVPATLEESARLRDENDRYHRHGIASVHQRHENLVRELRAAEERLFKIRPISIAGAAALVAYVHAELVCCANAGFEGGPKDTRQINRSD